IQLGIIFRTAPGDCTRPAPFRTGGLTSSREGRGPFVLRERGLPEGASQILIGRRQKLGGRPGQTLLHTRRRVLSSRKLQKHASNAFSRRPAGLSVANRCTVG